MAKIKMSILLSLSFLLGLSLFFVGCSE